MRMGWECVRADGRGVLWTVTTALAVLTMLGGGTGAQAADPGLAPAARAAVLVDLHLGSTGPVRLRVKARLLGLVTGDREGEYTLLLSTPEAWFEATRFPGYTDLGGRSGAKVWRKRNVLEKPYRMHQLAMMIDPAHHLRLPPEARVRRSWTAEGGLSCMEVGPTHDLWQHDRSGISALSPITGSDANPVTLCFDPNSGALRRVDYGLPLPRFEFDGEVMLGARRFPATMKCYEAKDLAIEATVVELAADTASDDTEFAVPEGAQSWPFCADPTPPRMIAKREAEHFAAARARGQFGTVVVLAEVGRDGILHDLTFVDARAKMLRLSIEKVVNEWKYQPATCEGEPIPADIYLKYTFLPR